MKDFNKCLSSVRFPLSEITLKKFLILLLVTNSGIGTLNSYGVVL